MSEADREPLSDGVLDTEQAPEKLCETVRESACVALLVRECILDDETVADGDEDAETLSVTALDGENVLVTEVWLREADTVAAESLTVGDGD